MHHLNMFQNRGLKKMAVKGPYSKVIIFYHEKKNTEIKNEVGNETSPLGIRIPLPKMVQKSQKFPGDKPIPLEEQALQPTKPVEFSRQQTQLPKLTMNEKLQNHRISPVPVLDANIEDPGTIASTMIDLNSRPNRIHGQPSSSQVQGMNALSDSNHE